MQLYRKVKVVEKIFKALGRDIDRFQQAAKIHCIEGCGVCCTKKGIEASPLEFLPLAYHLFAQHRQGEIFESLSKDDVEDICIFYDRIGDAERPGRCMEHPHRGLICRLFGFSGITDRTGHTHPAVCRPIKDKDTAHYLEVDRAVTQGLPIPRGTDYYMMLNAVDPALMTYYPINVAVRKSIETVLGYYSYRRRPAG